MSLSSDGFQVVPGALSAATVARLNAALDRVYDEERQAGRVAEGDAMHMLGGIGRDDAFVDLVDQPAVFPAIWRELGWNIHVYHSHLDVTPPPRAGAPRQNGWGWHQDGGRVNIDLESDPRPRLSLKVAYWLSDVSEPGRGNMLVVPGSHERNTLPRSEPPAGAMPVLASPGDALIFDRRLWHSRSENTSPHTRKAVFLAYTYRWIQPRDDFGIDPSGARFARLSPVRRQLLGESGGPRCRWGIGDEAVPLRAELSAGGALDPAIPSHR
jgi:ectoine hydroxylase-related dioxygenase (phytanoyl-CoA dioxygenase family)